MNVAFKNVEADRRGAQKVYCARGFMLETHPRLRAGPSPRQAGLFPPTCGSVFGFDPSGGAVLEVTTSNLRVNGRDALESTGPEIA